MQKALELRKKSFLPLEVCEAKARRRRKKRKRREEKSSLALFRFDSITPWNFPGIVRNMRFNVSIFRVWTGRGGGAWSFLRRVHVVLWDTGVKQSRLLSRFKPRVEIRAS